MKQYELLYIIPGQYTDDEVKEIQKTVAGLLKKVEIEDVVSDTILDRIRLAYPVKKVTHGTYVLLYFDAKPEKVPLLDRQLRLQDEVLRHMIVVRPKDAESKTYTLSSYVPPMSAEAQEKRREKRKEEKRKEKERREEAREALESEDEETSTDEAAADETQDEQNKEDAQEEVDKKKDKKKKKAKKDKKDESVDMDSLNKKLEKLLDEDIGSAN